jgi:glyoxylate reductase
VNPALLKLENVVLAPHLGSATDLGRIAMGERVIANIEALVAGKPLPEPQRHREEEIETSVPLWFESSSA